MCICFFRNLARQFEVCGEPSSMLYIFVVLKMLIFLFFSVVVLAVDVYVGVRR